MTQLFARTEQAPRAPQPAARPRPRRRRPRSSDPLWIRVAARTSALAFLAFTIGYGLLAGRHLDGTSNPLADKLGYAAIEVRVSGLERHTPEAVLSAIGVTRGGSLIGFDANRARRLLENIDWIERASVSRIFPNQLEISVTERRPFALWQLDGRTYVIDRTGAALSSIPADRHPDLFLVTGDGAQTAAQELVNLLEARPLLRSLVRAAARVGQRRWNLYLQAGPVVALPEQHVSQALDRFAALEQAHHLSQKDLAVIDLRLPDRIAFVPRQRTQAAGDLKVSRR